MVYLLSHYCRSLHQHSSKDMNTIARQKCINFMLFHGFQKDAYREYGHQYIEQILYVCLIP